MLLEQRAYKADHLEDTNHPVRHEGCKSDRLLRRSVVELRVAMLCTSTFAQLSRLQCLAKSFKAVTINM